MGVKIKEDLINAMETINLWSVLLVQVLYSLGFDFTALGRTIKQWDYLLSRRVSCFAQSVLHLCTAPSSVKKQSSAEMQKWSSSDYFTSCFSAHLSAMQKVERWKLKQTRLNTDRPLNELNQIINKNTFSLSWFMWRTMKMSSFRLKTKPTDLFQTHSLCYNIKTVFLCSFLSGDLFLLMFEKKQKFFGYLNPQQVCWWPEKQLKLPCFWSQTKKEVDVDSGSESEAMLMGQYPKCAFFLTTSRRQLHSAETITNFCEKKSW